ncbi:hypothetical protein MNEG_4584, partial [Monoraphidium neglectum]
MTVGCSPSGAHKLAGGYARSGHSNDAGAPIPTAAKQQQQQQQQQQQRGASSVEVYGFVGWITSGVAF